MKTKQDNVEQFIHKTVQAILDGNCPLKSAEIALDFLKAKQHLRNCEIIIHNFHEKLIERIADTDIFRD